LSKFLAALIIVASPSILLAQVDTKWKIHDLNRPVPPVVDPGSASTQDSPGHPPRTQSSSSKEPISPDGNKRTARQRNGKSENGYAEVVQKSGFIYTKQSFGDCQLHVEFREPTPPHGESQERGNSGVFLMGLYEVQVLDSYENKTYADGQASALYGQYPPLVNAARPPGQWQWYDIVFHGPRFDAAGKLLRPGSRHGLSQRRLRLQTT